MNDGPTAAQMLAPILRSGVNVPGIVVIPETGLVAVLPLSLKTPEQIGIACFLYGALGRGLLVLL